MNIKTYPKEQFRSSGFRELVDGKTGYDILNMEGCPIKLPKANSMTLAALDMQSLEPKLAEWYINQNKIKQ